MTTQTRSTLDEAFVRELARAGVRAPLFAWWDEHARALPWRNGQTTPWGVLVCEVMSQQTQMSRVVPYWQAWMSQWPTARALAGAPKADVIQAWGRLGYPRRALRLQECARVVASEYDDELPRGYSELTALPGVGDYTASAVMSFAYGERIAVVDTNIRRVLSRVFLGEESLRRSSARSPIACCRPTRTTRRRGTRRSWSWERLSARRNSRSARCARCARNAAFSRPACQIWGSGARVRANGLPARTGRCAGVCCTRCANWSPRRAACSCMRARRSCGRTVRSSTGASLRSTRTG